MYLFPFLGPAAAGEKGRLYSCRRKEFLYVLEMLLCKHFCRCHDAGLISVSYCNQCRQYCHHSLAASDISLEEPVHLMSAPEVVAYLGYYPFLCSCERERKCFVASVESFADSRHGNSLIFAAAYIFLLQK